MSPPSASFLQLLRLTAAAALAAEAHPACMDRCCRRARRLKRRIPHHLRECLAEHLLYKLPQHRLKLCEDAVQVARHTADAPRRVAVLLLLTAPAGRRGAARSRMRSLPDAGGRVAAPPPEPLPPSARPESSKKQLPDHMLRTLVVRLLHNGTRDPIGAILDVVLRTAAILVQPRVRAAAARLDHVEVNGTTDTRAPMLPCRIHQSGCRVW